MLFYGLAGVVATLLSTQFSLAVASTTIVNNGCGTNQNPYCAGNSILEQLCCPYPNVCYWERNGNGACCPAGQWCDGTYPIYTPTVHPTTIYVVTTSTHPNPTTVVITSTSPNPTPVIITTTTDNCHQCVVSTVTSGWGPVTSTITQQPPAQTTANGVIIVSSDAISKGTSMETCILVVILSLFSIVFV